MSFKFKKNNSHRLRGEAATFLTISAIVIMSLGIFSGLRLSQKKTTVETKAQGVSCPLVSGNNPRLVSGGICEATINFTPGNPTPASPTRLTCALIDPSFPAGSQVVAGQKSMPANYDYFNLTSTGKFPLNTPSNLSSSRTYRLVVYQMNSSYSAVEPAGCIRETNYPGSTVISLFNTSQTQPTATKAPQATAQPTATKIPTATPMEKTQCETSFGNCATTCSSILEPLSSDYGCKAKYGSNYVCCGQPGQPAPIPTWTPIPSPTSSPKPTPTLPVSNPTAAQPPLAQGGKCLAIPPDVPGLGGCTEMIEINNDETTNCITCTMFGRSVARVQDTCICPKGVCECKISADPAPTTVSCTNGGTLQINPCSAASAQTSTTLVNISPNETKQVSNSSGNIFFQDGANIYYIPNPTNKTYTYLTIL